VSKLLKQKEWVTLEDAAKYLSFTLEEEVTKEDILRFAINKRFKLSVLLEHPTSVWKCSKEKHDFGVEFKAFTDIEYKVKKSTDLEHIRGVFDIPMIGYERRLLEEELTNESSIPVAELLAIDGIFVESIDGELYEIIDSWSEKNTAKKVECKPEDDTFLNPPQITHYYPASGIPSYCVLVFRVSTLVDFCSTLNDKTTVQTKTALTKEQNTLLKIIITMAKAGYSFNHKASRDKNNTAKEIMQDAQKIGIDIDEDTVRKYLKKSAELLDQEIK
jgi:hypothetical protein